MERLTPTQRAVLLMAARGCRNAEIAAHLGLGYSTVKHHLMEVYKRLGVRNRTEAVVALYRELAGER
jgi:DNA-binding CsgD family transcriptional regulator